MHVCGDYSAAMPLSLHLLLNLSGFCLSLPLGHKFPWQQQLYLVLLSSLVPNPAYFSDYFKSQIEECVPKYFEGGLGVTKVYSIIISNQLQSLFIATEYLICGQALSYILSKVIFLTTLWNIIFLLQVKNLSLKNIKD